MVIYDAGFRRSERDRDFYGAIKDNYGDAKLLEACDRAWRGKPEVPPARSVALAVPGRGKGRGGECMAL